jgi:hypothetical protein
MLVGVMLTLLLALVAMKVPGISLLSSLSERLADA